MVLKQRSPGEADIVTQAMCSGQVYPMDAEIAKVALADSIIYATALSTQTALWTQGDHFQGLPQVQYFPKVKP